MDTIYLVVGIIVLTIGIITYFIPGAVRFISLSRRPRVTSIMTLILGIATIVVAFLMN